MKFLMSGYSGRMGQQIVALAEAEGVGQLVYGWSPRAEGERAIQNLSEADPGKVKIVIDFSLPPGFREALIWSKENGIPFFSGTTGLEDSDFQLLKEAANSIPVLWAPNTSLGVNFLNELIRHLGALDGFDYQIIEAHHNQKKDAPSGTALFLQETLNSVVKNPAPDPLAIRGGGIFGDHEIMAMSKEEVITIKHSALTRSVFARGAIKGALWLKNQAPGHYSMKDILGLK
ncbi:MAG: 4-hydroxy-tetrahydrodipicolinate reductase [Bdellovibrionaceae bacterium]|nr:4-hydroxy-tetrahydrodipicolinate reductase [Pseudobdellovibrionaceae bacterium]|tara:strand:- start:75990 stop:76682 length:693 start_codon:yes stop_codon:yes gene_type:complete